MITAIIILVILSSLAAAIVTLASTQAVDEALDVSATKAYFAAQSGIEWGAHQALRNATCAAVNVITPIDNIAVTVSCAVEVAASNNPTIKPIFRVTATACNLPSGTNCPGNTASPHYVERRLVALVEAQ